MKQLFVLVLLLSPYLFQAQKRLELVHENAFSFYDYQEKAFCVLDDSTFLWKYNVKKEKWEKKPIELRLEMPFTKFLTDFIAMSEKGSAVYFVFGGCGVVYAKKGNVIQRHDHSFYQMNQFNGSFFMDEGEPRIYGGYGLFTNKNIITRYDTIEREWFMINSGQCRPPAGIKNLIKKNKYHYYVFDGFKWMSRSYLKMENVWRFDMRSSKWKNMGKLNPKISEKYAGNTYEKFQTIKNGFSCFHDEIIHYDFEKMHYEKYKLNTSGLYKYIIQVDSLFLICKTTSKPLRFIVITDSSFLNQLDFEDGSIILHKTTSNNRSFIYFLFPLLLIILFIFWRYKNHSKAKNFKKLKPALKVNTFLDEFNQTELDLLQLLVVHQETGLEISQINDLVNYDQPSIDTLKKRREILLKDLRYKLAAKFNLPLEDVFIERRMETDKRMKLLFLNDSIHLKL
jgi:hypothetical protein